MRVANEWVACPRRQMAMGRCKKPDDRLERNPMRHFAVVTSLLVAWLVPSSANSQRVVAETFVIPAVDAGIQLHVRNKRLEGRDSFPGERVVLFVHGATYPSETVFDIDLPGGSWAEHVARKGYDVYLVDVRGYGRSMRPAAAPSGESAFRDDGRRGEGCRRGGRFYPQAPRDFETKLCGLVMGNCDHGRVHDE